MEKMDRQLLASRVEEELMNYIRNAPVEVGEKIPNEYELAQQFGVGRSTIRETVRSLATKGVLEVRRGSGTYVISKSTIEEDPLGLANLEDPYELVMDLFEIRLMLEPEIAAQASMRATAKEKQELRRLCEEVEQLYMDGRDHTGKDIEFHSCIARCSKNRVVEQLQGLIQNAVVAFVNLTHRALMEETFAPHRAITEAIEKGDPVGARGAMIMHLTYSRQYLMKQKEQQGVSE
ncbi:MAG: FadR/GntR family transcriptional regulator [Marvinbryantia sp.]|jgi:GntR family transcriptional repressor for pyruvate dehydrogenase complex